jgi:lipoate-protein ligase B
LKHNTLGIIDLGTSSYEKTYELQRSLVANKKSNECEDYILLVEHPNVFTIGRRGSRKNVLVGEGVLAKNDLKIVDADRGGGITFHGIGQLVIYPIFDLLKHDKDVRRYIKSLERVLELAVSNYGLAADREKKYTGLWVNGKKVGFIGIGVSHWISYHGISINANVDLTYFSMIKPCGLNNLKVSSLKEILNRQIDFCSLKNIFIKNFLEVFGFESWRKCSEDAFLVKEKNY